MRRNNTETIGSAIQRYLKVSGIDKKIKEIKAVRQWEELIGRNVARATENILIKNGILHVKLSSPVVKHELSMIKNEIVKRMNENAGEILVTDIKLW